MCGLVGIIGKPTFQEMKAFKELIIFDTVRGYHSTGLATVDFKGTAHTFKRAVPGWTFVEIDTAKSELRCGNSLYIGHNRAATVGAVNEVNAHPFTHGSFTGCHNGTLKSRHGLLNPTDFEVDSENIINSVSKQGVIETISQLNGAYALTIYDEESETFYVARNSERTLYHTTTENGTVFYASDKNMLFLALERAGVKHSVPQAYAIHTLYSYSLNVAASVSKNVIEEVNKTPYKPYVPPVVASTRYVAPARQPVALPATQKDYEINTSGWSKKSKALLKKLGIASLSEVEAVACDLDKGGAFATAVSLDGAYVIEIHGMKSKPHEALAKQVMEDNHIFLTFSRILGVKELENKEPCLIAYIGDVVCKDWTEASDSPLIIEEDAPVLVDHKLTPITETEFYQRYSSCIWCSTGIDHRDEEIELLDANSVLCGDCACDPALESALVN